LLLFVTSAYHSSLSRPLVVFLLSRLLVSLLLSASCPCLHVRRLLLCVTSR
jgi:hypothetical protein